MLTAQLRPHREYLLAQSPGQKLFLLLRLRPQPEARAARPELSVAFVVDTSGSMREVVRGAKNKIDLVAEGLGKLLASDLLRPEDQLALVKFDDQPEVLAPFTPAREADVLRAAVGRLTRYSGGTHMGAGMRLAGELLAQQGGSRRMVVLTDGQAFDELVVQEVADELARAQIPVTTVGVGDEVNTALLLHVTDRTQGQPIDVVPDTRDPQPPAIRASDLPQALLGDLESAAGEVVTRVGLTIRTVKDVVLDRVTRVHPTQTEVDRSGAPLALGNVDGSAGATYLLEFSLPARPPARMRLAQLGLSYEVPGAGFRGEVPPLDVVVEFTHDEALAARTDPEVMQWVQQRNIEGLVAQATREVQSNPQQAQKTLELARTLTMRLGQGAMTQALERAIDEVSSAKTISLGTAKTLRIGAKTQTLRVNAEDVPSDADIRKLTGA